MSEQTTEAQTTELPEVPFEVPEGWRLVSDDEAEALARQLVEDHRENWEIQEIVDAAVEACEMNDMLRNEFYYEYKQGGRQVRGLTAKMIAHLAAARSITEEVKLRKYDGEGDTHEFEVVVSIPDAFHPDGKLCRSGFAEEPKELKGMTDKFGKIKAYTKAFRRACEKLLPQDLLIAATYKLAKLVPADWQPPARQQKALPAPKQNGADTAREKARNAAFAKYKTRKPDLEALGITEDIFKMGVYTHYNVKSSDEMTEAQCSDLEISLDMDGEFADWITALAAKKEGAAAEKPPSF